MVDFFQLLLVAVVAIFFNVDGLNTVDALKIDEKAKDLVPNQLLGDERGQDAKFAQLNRDNRQ